MNVLALPRADWLLVFSGAVLTSLAYPPFHFFIPSFLCLVPAVLLIDIGLRDPSPLRRHLMQGFAFGIGTNGLLLYWMAFALWKMTPVMVPVYLASVLVLSTYAALVFALVGWVRRVTHLSLLLVFPIMWTAAEWVIGHQSDLSFPWLGLGTSLTGYTTFIQFADLVGARGVTFALVTANAALALAWLDRKRPRVLGRRLGSVAFCCLAAALYGMIRERQIVLRPAGNVGVIQPNIPIEAKQLWTSDSIVSTVLTLSNETITGGAPDLMVWPEAVVPEPFRARRDLEARVAEHARVFATPLVVGGRHVVDSKGAQPLEHNSAFVFDEFGSWANQPAYHKRYLVPVIERIPFVRRGGFHLDWTGDVGVAEHGSVYQTALGRFGILICYESAFEDLTRHYRRSGAEFVINMTNDVWFGRSSGPYQHEAHLVMRAIENRVGVVRAANSGVSEIITPLGRRQHQTRLETRAGFTAPLFVTDSWTVYTRLGDWVGGMVMLMAFGVSVYAWWERRQKNLQR